MAALATITSALALHSAIAAFSVAVPDEDASEAMIEASAEALEAALAIPATTLSDVRLKLAAIMGEADCGLVELESLVFIARDLDALVGGVVQ